MSSFSLETLRDLVQGRVITPQDKDYDEARTIVAGGYDKRPKAIVKVADAQDVSAVVGFARDNGQELAIRGGGHSGAGHSASEGGIVLDVRELKSLEIDAQERTAWAGAGITAGEYTTAAGEHGLVTGFGDTGSVGLPGITLAGGIGFLVRKHGLAIDNLLAAEIVTANGELLQIDEQSHPDLFWAIRGGGGNFGVITRLKFRLHELPEIVGGMLMLPVSADVIENFVALAEAAPEELSGITMVMTAPPMPFIPAEWHGRLVMMALLAYAGPAEDGQRVIAPFRALATPILDMVQAQPYAALFPPEDTSYHPTAAAQTMFIDSVGAAEAATIIKYLEESDAQMRAAQLRVLGGAMARVPADATAFAHRQSKIMVNVAAFYNGEADKPAKEAWVTAFANALRQNDSGAYSGFLGDEGPERVRNAYPGSTWDRLAAVKAQYDPENLFRLNQNVPPAK
ncbi:FAD-binding oxidoreductase [Catelliglobosispora koreensis]|uniref:FAD-binding oxidoreductase n=1 Tax=Catelliglobosispora koreensis TaxID=129052 RepID=UPI00035E6137|nr:FAD-binding oxidoreductase [Catelliglobosispora koreensis]